MTHFDYGFTLTLKNNDQYCLTFLDIPHLTLTENTRDHIFQKAQSMLDDYLYSRLKTGKKIPTPKISAPYDKRLAPSDAIKEALNFYMTA